MGITDEDKKKLKKFKSGLEQAEGHETEQKNNAQDFMSNVFFPKMKEALDNTQIANKYLFQLAEKTELTEGLYDGIYKISIIKKDKDKGIVCKISGLKNFGRTLAIPNKVIIKLKPEVDDYVEVEDKETEDQDDKKKNIQIKIADFLDEFQYQDSVIVKVEKGKTQMIQPDKLLQEIRKYVNGNRDFEERSTKQIALILKFLSESTNQYASDFIGNIVGHTSGNDLKMKIFGTKEKEKIKEILSQDKKKKEEYEEARKENLRKFIEEKFMDPEMPIYIHKEKDIDNQAALFLLRISKVYNKEKKVITINQGEEDKIEKGIFIDIGNTVTGFKATKNKLTFSEHAKGGNKALFTNRPNSTTHIIFTIFQKLGLFEEKDINHIQRFVEFVDKVDSMNYQISGVDYQNNYRTLLGLHKNLVDNGNIHDIYYYFKDAERTGFEILPDHYLKSKKTKDKKGREISLKEISEKRKNEIERNKAEFKEMENQGYILKYKSTKFIVDIGKEKKSENGKEAKEETGKKENGEIIPRLNDGPQVAGYNGFGLFKIRPQRGNIYIYSPNKLPPKIEGFDTQGNFLIINSPTIQDLENLLKKFEITETSKEGLHDDIRNFLERIQAKQKK